DARTGGELATFDGHQASVTAVAFGPGGTLLLSGSADGTARIWDVRSGEVREVLSPPGEIVENARVFPDGRRVMIATDAGTVGIYACELCSGNFLSLARDRLTPVVSARQRHPTKAP